MPYTWFGDLEMNQVPTCVIELFGGFHELNYITFIYIYIYIASASSFVIFNSIDQIKQRFSLLKHV